MRNLCIIFFLALVLLCCKSALNADGQKQLLEELNTAARDSVSPGDLENLSKTITRIYEKYKFNDSDIEKLGADAVSAVFAISDYNEALNKTGDTAKAQPPKKEVAAFLSSLTDFVKKYRISGDDTLALARDITLVTLGARKGAGETTPGRENKPTREDMSAIFSRLIDFSRAHKIQTEDMMPLASRLSDIALSVLQNEAERKKLEAVDPEKAKEMARTRGISQDQVMGLIQSLMAFQKKYRIDLGELWKLTDDIRKKL